MMRAPNSTLSISKLMVRCAPNSIFIHPITPPPQHTQLVEDDTALFLLRREMSRRECAKGFVLEGLPRSELQAKKLDTFLGHAGIGIDKVSIEYNRRDAFSLPLTLPPPFSFTYPTHTQVIDLEVSDAEATRRLEHRLVHPPSGRVYNEQTIPPRVPFTDDVTGEPLVRRADDVEEKLRRPGGDDEWGSLARRLSVWGEEAGRVLGYYRAQGKLAVVEGEAPPEEVMRRVEKALEGTGGGVKKGKGGV